jgi:N-acetylglucosaminyldiphosphoundecaprenol N-acetyl-beta-D-mannosaminyltransferase
MRILIVSSYPPRHCGIGAYAAAQAGRLADEGHEVVVLSPPDGGGDLQSGFFRGRAFRRAAKIGGGFDRIVVHFQPGLYFRARSPFSHVVTAASLVWLVLRRPAVEILVHEATSPPSRLRPDYRLLGMAFSRAQLRFHTEAERVGLERDYRIRTRSTLVPHEASVVVHARVSRPEARARLGIETEEPIFLLPGFIHLDKGFDRAVRAFAAAGSPGRLYVVGSVRTATPEILGHADDLRALCEETEGTTMIERFVSDEDFDVWISAADRVVLPYRRAWSSGALARAQLLGTPALVAGVGGLAEQAGENDIVFHSEDALARLFALPVTTDAESARGAVRLVDREGPTDRDDRVDGGDIFGVHVHDVPSADRVREVCGAFLAGERTFRVFTPNPEILLRAREDRSYAALLNSADLALPDGTGVAMIQSLRARRRVRRWPGVEIGALLLELASERDATVAFLGGADGVAERAAARWRMRLPRLRLAVVGSGVRVADDGRSRPAERDSGLVEQIRALAPAILFVGLGAPKQERWIARHADDLPSVRIAIGIGGAFDMWAERLRRAPKLVHRIGLEWLWRLALEPGRLPRIVRATIVFPFRALTDRAG